MATVGCLSSSLIRDAVRARGVDTDTTRSLNTPWQKNELSGFRHTTAPLRGFSFICTTGALPYASLAAVAFDGGCLPAHGLGFFLLEPVFPFFEASSGARSVRTSFPPVVIGLGSTQSSSIICLTSVKQGFSQSFFVHAGVIHR